MRSALRIAPPAVKRAEGKTPFRCEGRRDMPECLDRRAMARPGSNFSLGRAGGKGGWAAGRKMYPKGLCISPPVGFSQRRRADLRSGSGRCQDSGSSAALRERGGPARQLKPRAEKMLKCPAQLSVSVMGTAESRQRPAPAANRRSARRRRDDSGERGDRWRIVQPYENQIIIAGMLYKNLCNCRLIHCTRSTAAQRLAPPATGAAEQPTQDVGCSGRAAACWKAKAASKRTGRVRWSSGCRKCVNRRQREGGKGAHKTQERRPTFVGTRSRRIDHSFASKSAC